jgi:hypothetical protein
MSLWTRLRSWTSATVRSTRMEREMDDEMRFHLEAHVIGFSPAGTDSQRR